MPDRPNTPAVRFLAPLALVIVAIAFFAVLLGSGGSDDSGGGSASTAQAPKPSAKKGSKPKPKPKPKVYVVKPSDTLALISQKTKVSAEKLQEVNPGLDPQALVPGQKIKLQE
jgi:LysM repeat protein